MNLLIQKPNQERKNKFVLVMFLKYFPSFEALIKNSKGNEISIVYGPFSPKDTIYLPEKFARILSKKGKVKILSGGDKQ